MTRLSDQQGGAGDHEHGPGKKARVYSTWRTPPALRVRGPAERLTSRCVRTWAGS